MIEETRQTVEDSVKTDIESREGRKRIAEAEAAKSRYEKVEVTVSKQNYWVNWLRDGHATVRRKNLYERTNVWQGGIDFFEERVIQPHNQREGLPF
jgi:hypothetical protein